MRALQGKTVLITGGTGSFGQAMVKFLLSKSDVDRLIVFSRDELKQFEMQQTYNDPRLRFFIGDVRDRDRLRRAFDGVDFVIHAAALKQVPAAEYNPMEAVKTNIHGAANVIEAALDTGVQRVIALSTDKAVAPVNLYGATKLVSDKLFVAANSYAGKRNIRFAVVRYGNVVGSRGSVVPFFLERKATGRLPITDPRMTRFWITLEQGVRFVLKSLERAQGGEIFVPKIPTARILDLAKAIAPEAEIENVGIRPGEKIHEVLITEDEARHTLEFDDHFIIEPEFPWWGKRPHEGGRPCPDGFVYSSATNPWVLSVDEIRKLIFDSPNGAVARTAGMASVEK